MRASRLLRYCVIATLGVVAAMQAYPVDASPIARSGVPSWIATGLAGPGAQLWVQRTTTAPGSGSGLEVSPQGSKVFVTGPSATIAYSASTGAQLWATPNRPGTGFVVLAVSPDASKVFVTGYSAGSTSVYDLATMAYDALTGAQLWGTRYNGGYLAASASAIGVSPDGSMVFVTGYEESTTEPSTLYVTIAYKASTGAQLWVSAYAGNPDNRANALGVSPDGSKVFVTGSSGTIAYNASTGAQLWVRNYASGGFALGVSPDGSKVFVTGSGTLGSDYTTVAYDASAGGQLWVKRYKGPGNDYAYPRAVEVSRDGSKVFVTGGSPGVKSGSYAYATLAYNASTGARLWVKRYGVSYSGGALALGTSPDGSKVFVTGVSGTIAYNASTGTQLWVRNFSNYPVAFALGVSPDGSKVFVTGGAPNPGGVGSIYTTIAYSVT